MDEITVIVPCYNEETTLVPFYEEADRVGKEISGAVFEYLFVDDGSKDATLEVIKSLREKDEKVKYISFSRNFGKEAAFRSCLLSFASCCLEDRHMAGRQWLVSLSLLEGYSYCVSESQDCIYPRYIWK